MTDMRHCGHEWCDCGCYGRPHCKSGCEMDRPEPEPDSIRDVEAKGIPVQVVACKLPGAWIIRAIAPFQTVDTLKGWIDPYVTLLGDRPLEWSQHLYRIPSYLVYGGGDLPRLGWPETGVFLFTHHGDPDGGVYRDAKKLRGGS